MCGQISGQKAFELLKEYLLKEPILVYPDTGKPYTLYTDASKYAWAGVLTQRYVHEIEGKEKEIYHPVTYLRELFRGSQLNRVTLTKEAYAIFGCIFYSYFLTSMEHRSLLVVCFTSTKSLRGPPWNEGHRPKVSSRDLCT